LNSTVNCPRVGCCCCGPVIAEAPGLDKLAIFVIAVKRAKWKILSENEEVLYLVLYNLIFKFNWIILIFCRRQIFSRLLVYTLTDFENLIVAKLI